MNNTLSPDISTQSRWLGKYAEGIIWPLWLFVVFHLGQERWLHTDSAYTLYRILNHQSLFYDRFACELIVWPGQLLTWLGAPISWVMQSLNLVLPLMAWLTWAAAAKSTHRWIMFLLFLAGGSEVFFIGYSEIGLATWAFLSTLLLLDLTQYFKAAGRQKLFYELLIAMGWTILLLSHPASLLYAPILIGISLATRSKSENLVLLSIVSVCFIVKSFALPSNTYDGGLYQTLFSRSTWTQFGSLWSVDYLLHADWFFIPATTSFAALLIGITKPWRWISLFHFVLTIIAIVVSLLIYSQGDAHINMEKFFFPVAVISMLSIPAYLWGSQRPKFGEYRLYKLTAKQRELSQSLIGILPWFLALSMLLGIQKHSPTYTNRKHQLFTLVDAMPHGKMIAHYDTLSKRIFPGSLWGLPYETALASAFNAAQGSDLVELPPTKTMKPMSSEELADWSNIQSRIGDTVVIGAPFEMPQPIAKLNRRYFRYQTKTTYQQW